MSRFDSKQTAQSVAAFLTEIDELVTASDVNKFTREAADALSKGKALRDDIKNPSVRREFNSVLKSIRDQDKTVVNDNTELDNAKRFLKNSAIKSLKSIAKTLEGHHYNPATTEKIEDMFSNAWDHLKSAKNLWLDATKSVEAAVQSEDNDEWAKANNNFAMVHVGRGDAYVPNALDAMKEAARHFDVAQQSLSAAATLSRNERAIGEVYQNDIIDLVDAMANVETEFERRLDEVRGVGQVETKFRKSVIEFNKDVDSAERGLARLTGKELEARTADEMKDLRQTHNRSVGQLRGIRNRARDELYKSMKGDLTFLTRAHQRVGNLQRKTPYINR